MNELLPALDAIEVLSPSSYAWLGRRSELAIPSLDLVSAPLRRRALVERIGLRLYIDFFAVGAPRPSQDRTARGGRRMAEQLAGANGGIGSFDDGWTYRRRDGARHVVERNGLMLWVDDDDLRVAGAVANADPGDVVAVRWAKDAPIISPGFYMALGDHGFAAPRPQPLDRFYLNVPPAGAVTLMGQATSRLNGAGLPFRLKIVDDPDGYDRCDTAVLVVQRRDRDRAFDEVWGIHTAIAAHLRAGTPALAKRLAPGLAFAEDPGGGRSFGAHRCDLIAAAVVDAFERGIVGVHGRLEVVRRHFAAAGVSLDAPHLGGDRPSVSVGDPTGEGCASR